MVLVWHGIYIQFLAESGFVNVYGTLDRLDPGSRSLFTVSSNLLKGDVFGKPSVNVEQTRETRLGALPVDY